MLLLVLKIQLKILIRKKKKSENVLQTSKNEFDRLPEVIKNLENEAELKVRVFKDKIEENTQKNIQDIQKNVERSLLIEEEKDF